MKFPLFASIFLFSCSGNPSETKAPRPVPVTDTITSIPHRLVFVPSNAPRDLSPVHKFPGKTYQKVVAFELSGNVPREYAQAVFLEQTGKKVELTTAQVTEFLMLINNRKNYGVSEKACFEPRIGLICYDANETPVAYLSLCMECHNLRSEPSLDLGLEQINKTGFSEKAYRQLGDIFTSWGF